MPPNVLNEVTMQSSSACTSTGWVVGILVVHNWEIA